MTEFHAYYSPTAAKQFGVSIWERPDGTQVGATEVCRDRDGVAYLFPDKIYVGVVSKCIQPMPMSKNSKYELYNHKIYRSYNHKIYRPYNHKIYRSYNAELRVVTNPHLNSQE